LRARAGDQKICLAHYHGFTLRPKLGDKPTLSSPQQLRAIAPLLRPGPKHIISHTRNRKSCMPDRFCGRLTPAPLLARPAPNGAEICAIFGMSGTEMLAHTHPLSGESALIEAAHVRVRPHPLQFPVGTELSFHCLEIEALARKDIIE